MRVKNKQGQFKKTFSSHSWGGDYAEGSAWQSSFAVYHDFTGLVKLNGGKCSFKQKLIKLCNQNPIFEVDAYGFEIHEMSEMATLDFGQLAISNQPSFHYPYLFSYIGKPEMAQPLLKQLMTECFNATSTGYPRDEDNGSTAGWYIFNSLGFSPVTSGSGEYVIGIPLVKNAKLFLSNGKILEITAKKNASQHQFIHELKFNDTTHTALYIKHDDLFNSGVLSFDLGIVPNQRKYENTGYTFSLPK